MKNVKQKHKKREKARKARAKRLGHSVAAIAESRRTDAEIEEIPVVEGPHLTLPSHKTFHVEDVWEDAALPIESLGSGLKLVKRMTVNFTKTLAEDMLDPDKYTTFAPDRSFSKQHANRLLRAMQQGTFRWEQFPLIVCSCGGKTYRMNGQHTSWARIYFEGAPDNLPVQLFRYAAETEADMRMLYASIDRNKPRSKANVIQSYLYDSEQFPGFSKAVLRQLAEGLSFWLWGVNQAANHSGDEIAYLLQTDYYGLALKVGQFMKSRCQNQESQHMKRSPVMAALFATFDKNERQSIAFWGGVQSGADLNATDPRLKLRNRLQNYAINAGRGGGTYKNMVPADDMYAWCIQAWNALRKDKPIIAFRGAKAYKTRPRAE